MENWQFLAHQVTEKDKVEVKGAEEKSMYILPIISQVGIETNSPRENLFPLGRLDKASHGLFNTD